MLRDYSHTLLFWRERGYLFLRTPPWTQDWRPLLAWNCNAKSMRLHRFGCAGTGSPYADCASEAMVQLPVFSALMQRAPRARRGSMTH